MTERTVPFIDATGTAVTSRRGVLRAAAWVTPAVVVASAAPAFAASEALFLQSNVSEQDLQDMLDNMPDITQGPVTIDPSDGVPSCVSTAGFASQISFSVVNGSGTGVSGKQVTFVLTGAKFLNQTQTATVTSSTGGAVSVPGFYIPQGVTSATITAYITANGPSTAGTPVSIPLSGNVMACAIAGSGGYAPGIAI